MPVSVRPCVDAPECPTSPYGYQYQCIICIVKCHFIALFFHLGLTILLWYSLTYSFSLLLMMLCPCLLFFTTKVNKPKKVQKKKNRKKKIEKKIQKKKKNQKKSKNLAKIFSLFLHQPLPLFLDNCSYDGDGCTKYRYPWSSSPTSSSSESSRFRSSCYYERLFVSTLLPSATPFIH